MQIPIADVVNFHRRLTSHYYQYGRHAMAWRQPDSNGQFDPYKILVSEIMLQQTQVDRVTPKYHEFLQRFPYVQSLAKAPLSDVLTLWSGLGYNRRAKFLWQAGGKVAADYQGMFPDSTDELQQLPGIGPNTAGAIAAYAYNQPVVFIETNIRTVVLYHFFQDRKQVADKDIRLVMQQLVPQQTDTSQTLLRGAALEPRQFYWALMDYGSYLKKTVGNVNILSKHYNKQSKFKGSRRQIRGQVIRLLAAGPLTTDTLRTEIIDERLEEVLEALEREGLIAAGQGKYRLA